MRRTRQSAVAALAAAALAGGIGLALPALADTVPPIGGSGSGGPNVWCAAINQYVPAAICSQYPTPTPTPTPPPCRHKHHGHVVIDRRCDHHGIIVRW